MKKFIYLIALVCALVLPASLFAGMGYVSAKSSDVDIKLLGSEEFQPTFIYNADFDSDHEVADWIGREDGHEQQFDIRNQFRMGWMILGNKWKGFFLLEDDVNATKTNIDRSWEDNRGWGSNEFGLERLDFEYMFNKYFTLEMGWNVRALDIKTGGLVYADDHPFFGFKGAGKNWKYEIMALFIRNDGSISGRHIRPGAHFSGHQDDLIAYTAKLYYTFGTSYGKLTVAPFFAAQDNQIARAQSYYFGLELFGKLGIVVPRFEVVYVTGTQDGYTEYKNGAVYKTDEDADIDAWAGFLSFEFDLCKAFKPYIGGWYIEGDDDASDDDINNFQGITGIQKFTPTFGLGYGDSFTDTNLHDGTVLYSLNPILLGVTKRIPLGYGGIGGAGRSFQPGIWWIGLGFKGDLSDVVYKGLSYKLQGFYAEYDDTGALEDFFGQSIDDNLGWGVQLKLDLALNKHFTIENTTVVFDPDDGVKDLNKAQFGLRGADDTMVTSTFNFKFVW